MNTAIHIDGLTKRFRRTYGYLDLLPWKKRKTTTALENVNLEIRSGELFGLLGPNGAGKTTLIKILCGLILPSDGTAYVFGHDVRKESQMIGRLVGMTSVDERSFYWRLTGRQNLNFYAALYRVPSSQREQRIEEVLNKVGLASEAEVRFQNYSTGMRQRLAIARGLLYQPKALFVDEPTRSLDPLSARAVRTLLREEVDKFGRTIVLATHNMDEAQAICDRVAILNHGSVVMSGRLQEMRSLLQKRDRCELVVRHPTDNIMDRLLVTEGVVECQKMPESNGMLHLNLTLLDRTAVLPRVLQAVMQDGGEVCDCRLVELPLEEIFVQAIKPGVAGNV